MPPPPTLISKASAVSATLANLSVNVWADAGDLILVFATVGDTWGAPPAAPNDTADLPAASWGTLFQTSAPSSTPHVFMSGYWNYIGLNRLPGVHTITVNNCLAIGVLVYRGVASIGPYWTTSHWKYGGNPSTLAVNYNDNWPNPDYPGPGYTPNGVMIGVATVDANWPVTTEMSGAGIPAGATGHPISVNRLTVGVNPDTGNPPPAVFGTFGCTFSGSGSALGGLITVGYISPLYAPSLIGSAIKLDVESYRRAYPSTFYPSLKGSCIKLAVDSVVPKEIVHQAALYGSCIKTTVDAIIYKAPTPILKPALIGSCIKTSGFPLPAPVGAVPPVPPFSGVLPGL